MGKLLSLANVQLTARLLAQRAGVEPVDLSSVSDPVGRVDFLMSKLVEQGVKQLQPEAQMTYHVARPLIDGMLARAFAERVKVPEEVIEFVKAQMRRGEAA